MSNKYIEIQIKKLNQIAKIKVSKDLKGSWSEGSKTYLNGLYDELKEVTEELKSGRQCFLEDELGDVLWDYFCMLQHLQLEEKISMPKVFDRAVEKYTERVVTRQDCESWEEVKLRQKIRLQKELDSQRN